MENPIYLDANASAPPIEAAIQALSSSLNQLGNPSSPHLIGRQARKALDKARVQVANALGANEKEIYFNSGASEGNRWLVDAIVQGGKDRGKPYRVFVSNLEHPSMAKPLAVAVERGEIELSSRLLGPVLNADSPVPVASAESNRIRDDRVEIIICTVAHNETGIIPNWDAIIDSVDEDTILIADAAQAMGRLGALPARMDAIVVSAHKLGGFPGVGAVVIRGNAKKLTPPWAGGGQESGLRPGTEAVNLIAAFGAACGEIQNTREANRALAPLRDALEKAVLGMYPRAKIISDLGAAAQDSREHGNDRGWDDIPRLPNTSAICFDGLDGEALRISLDAAGLCVGFGSACSALAPEPSPSLIAMGLTPEQAKATVRFSLPIGFSEADLKLVTEKLEMVLSRLQ